MKIRRLPRMLVVLTQEWILGLQTVLTKGERSGVLEEGPRAILNPFKENYPSKWQKDKNPNEPMFTLTVTDRHGIVHKGTCAAVNAVGMLETAKFLKRSSSIKLRLWECPTHSFISRRVIPLRWRL